MITKTCKRCGASITLKPDPSCPQEWVDIIAGWVSMCDRCADYGYKRSKLIESIGRHGFSLEKVRSKPVRSASEDASVNNDIESIKTLVKAFAKHVCEFYRSNLVWDDEFAMNVVYHPDQAAKQLSMYEIGIRQAVQKDDPF